MKKYWLLSYKQSIEDVKTKESEMISDWGRIGKQFKSLEDLLNYVAYSLLEKDIRCKDVPLEVDSSMIIKGRRLYGKNQKPVSDSDIDKAETAVIIEAQAFYVEEDEARIEDYDAMKELVKIV